MWTYVYVEMGGISSLERRQTRTLLKNIECFALLYYFFLMSLSKAPQFLLPFKIETAKGKAAQHVS